MGHGIGLHDLIKLKSEAWHGHPNALVLGRDLTVDDVNTCHHWEPMRLPLTYVFDGEERTSENAVAWVRSDNGHELSAMSPKYEGFTYADNFVPMAEALIEAGFRIVSTGSLFNGAKAFLSAEMPEGFSIDFPGWSETTGVTHIGDSLNGKHPFLVTQSRRVTVCSNTFNANILGVDPLIRIKHTKNATSRRDAALAAFAEQLRLSSEINDAVERLCNEAFTEAQFWEMVKAEEAENGIFGPAPEVKEGGRETGLTKWGNKMDAMRARYEGSDIDGIRETKMGALMAVQGYAQHEQVVRAPGVEPNVARDIRAMDREIFGEDHLSERAARYMEILV